MLSSNCGARRRITQLVSASSNALPRVHNDCKSPSRLRTGGPQCAPCARITDGALHPVRIITELEVAIVPVGNSAHGNFPMLSLRFNWAPQVRLVSAAGRLRASNLSRANEGAA
jgi:hypothetical protein